MLFTQFQFMFIFLPITLLGYFFLSRYHNSALRVAWLGLTSLFFYAYWDIQFLPIMLASIFFNYAISYPITNTSYSLRKRKTYLSLAVLANLGTLFYYKYASLAFHIFNKMNHNRYEELSILLPIGISFFTFTQIAYLVDVYRGKPSERHFLKYILFVTFFPHLIAGPILHHSEMMPQFGSEESRRFSFDKMALGLTIFALGLFKKLMIADNFSLLANPIFNAAGNGAIAGSDAWIGALSYSLQIYFDFSGYSDMAIGLSVLFGIRLPFNFDSPYKSKSIIEFWRRWHITLSRFLRDYLYIELGGNRKGTIARYGNLMLTMILGGLWHGAGYTFLIWGFLHGFYLMVNHFWRHLCKKLPPVLKFSEKLLWKVAMLLLTQFAVVIAWVFFKANNFRVASSMLKGMLGMGSSPDTHIVSGDLHYTVAYITAGYLICIALPNLKEVFEKYATGLSVYSNPRNWSVTAIRWNPTLSWALITAFCLLTGIAMNLIMGDRTPFLYFQF